MNQEYRQNRCLSMYGNTHSVETFHVFLVSKEKQQGFVMDAFDPAQVTASSSVTKLLPALAGLLVATVVAFSAASPRLTISRGPAYSRSPSSACSQCPWPLC